MTFLTGKSDRSVSHSPVLCASCTHKNVRESRICPWSKGCKENGVSISDITNPFSEKFETAGDTWLNGFLTRNSELSQKIGRTVTNLSIWYKPKRPPRNFWFVSQNYDENNFANHPENVFNMDESGIQINKKPKKAVATMDTKDVYTLSSCEKGKNVPVIACCNSQGNFLPLISIIF